jgi:hypothetical protein
VSGAALTLRPEGLAELSAHLSPALVADPMRSCLKGCGDSFVVELVPGAIPGGVVIANTSAHSLYLEFGTAPHFPPVEEVAPWAEAHGLEPYAVALGIAMHGTAPHPFLAPALEQSRGEIAGQFAAAARAIEARAGG